MLGCPSSGNHHLKCTHPTTPPREEEEEEAYTPPTTKGGWSARKCITPSQNRAGAVVLEVTGNYTGTLTQTAPPVVENYTFGVTMYDMLDAIQDTSAIVGVDGIISEDTTPYIGIDALDVNLRTEGYALSITVEGRDLKKTSVVDIDVKSGASTGIIKIEEETDNEQTVVCQTC